MAYNPNIPLVTDYMVVSQPQIQSNFQTIFSTFSENHEPLNSNEQGKHSEVVLTPQSGDPATTADQTALYSKTVGGNTFLFHRPANSATPIQLNYQNISTGLQSTSPDVYLPRQYSFLAGPFVFYMGHVTAATNGQIITLLPVTTLIYVGCVLNTQTFPEPTSAIPKNIAGNQFTIEVAAGLTGPFNFFYIAIGKP